MKALLSKAPGGTETLVLEEIESPTPGKGEVIIDVKAIGVNFPDTLIIQDLYQFKPERPFSPGGEVSGVVKAVGEGVTHLQVGQRVIGSCGWGGMREQFQNKHRISRHRAVAFTSENYFLERTAVFGFGGLAVVLLAMFRFFRNARARPPDGASPGRWPREALLIAGAAYYVQAQTQPTADPTGRYLLWLLFAVAERMHIAFTSGGGEDASDAASDAEQTA